MQEAGCIALYSASCLLPPLIALFLPIAAIAVTRLRCSLRLPSPIRRHRTSHDVHLFESSLCAALAEHFDFASIDELALAAGSFCHEYLLPIT